MNNSSAPSSFPLKAILAALVLGGGMFAALLFFLALSKPDPAPVGVVTAALTVIPSLSGTATPIPPEISPTPEVSATPTLAPNQIGVGAFVQVSGTGGDGLRLRQSPGLDSAMQFLALEGELFLIGDGPVQADGYTWWFLIGSYDETRQGWGAEDFLTIVAEP